MVSAGGSAPAAPLTFVPFLPLADIGCLRGARGPAVEPALREVAVGVDAAVAQLRDHRPGVGDLVIGIGGGAALDLAKATAALAAGLTIILCVGETEAQRDGGQATSVVGSQLAGARIQRKSADTRLTKRQAED